VALCEIGRHDEARMAFDALTAAGFTPRSTYLELYGLALAAEACAGVGDAEAAAVLADRLAPYEEFLPGGFVVVSAAVPHLLGLLATTLRRYDEADARFRAAEDMHRRLGAPALVARTQMEWARMLLGRSAAGDIDRANALLQQALTVARQLGLGTVERRASGLLRGSLTT
jgi:tetratricopeptide (TPR) repeat protein